MDDFDRRAIIAACAVVSASIESPGSQDPKNVEVALQILERYADLVRNTASMQTSMALSRHSRPSGN